MEENSIDSIFRIVRQISDRERAGSSVQSKKPKKNRLVARLYIELVVFPFFLAILITLVRRYYDLGNWLIEPALAMLATTYLGILLHPVISAIIYRKSILRGLFNPFYLILDNARSISAVDAKLLHYLVAKPTKNLKFLLLEINAEKAAFQKRISLIVGTVEKIGLIPGFLAVAATLSKLGNDQSEWVYALAYATPAMHIIGYVMHYLISRLERISSLVEHAIVLKEES